MKAIREASKLNLSAVAEATRLATLVSQESPAMKAIREFSNLPFSSAVRERVFSELDSLGRAQPDLEEYPDFTTDQDIQLEAVSKIGRSSLLPRIDGLRSAYQAFMR